MADTSRSNVGSRHREIPVGGRVRYKYDSSATTIVTDGYMSLGSALAVLQEALEEWEFRATTDEELDPILSKIAHVLRQGTSAERDFSKVGFEHGNRMFSMDVLRLCASKKDSSENPIRVWARSYNDGELAVRTYDMLNDPANIQLREQTALDYGCSLDVVHVSFDYAEALVNFPDFKLTQVERMVIKTNTANKVRVSRSAFIGSSDGGTVQDSMQHMANVASPMSLANQAGINPGGVNRRANFAVTR